MADSEISVPCVLCEENAAPDDPATCPPLRVVHYRSTDRTQLWVGDTDITISGKGMAEIVAFYVRERLKGEGNG